MRFKRFSAMLLALAMCMGVFSTTVFAYSDESATTTTTEKAETVETVPEKTEDKTSEEVPYTVTVNEDGTVVFSFNGKEWTYGAEESEDNNMGTGKVVTSGSRLNVRTGAGMNYEIIDQLRPGEEVVVVGVEGDWYQITVPEKNGYVHSDYLELIEKAEQNSEMDMALLMMFMSAFMQNTDTSEPALTPDGNLTLVDDVGSPTKSIFDHIEGNPENVVVDPLETIDYTIKVISQKGNEKLIQGTYDKKGLPDDWAEFMESVFEFMSFYGWGEIMNPSVYGKVRRCDNDIIYCSVEFEDGCKSYYYISDDDSIQVGDFVIVPAGKDNHEAVVEVVKKEYFAEENVPLPMEKTKHIIRKCTDADFDLPDDEPV